MIITGFNSSCKKEEVEKFEYVIPYHEVTDIFKVTTSDGLGEKLLMITDNVPGGYVGITDLVGKVQYYYEPNECVFKSDIDPEDYFTVTSYKLLDATLHVKGA